jgi:hypothetical protein
MPRRSSRKRELERKPLFRVRPKAVAAGTLRGVRAVPGVRLAERVGERVSKIPTLRRVMRRTTGPTIGAAGEAVAMRLMPQQKLARYKPTFLTEKYRTPAGIASEVGKGTFRTMGYATAIAAPTVGAQAIVLRAGPQLVKNIVAKVGGEDVRLTRGLGEAAERGVESAAILQITNMITDKALSFIAPKLTQAKLGTSFEAARRLKNFGMKPAAWKAFKQGVAKQITRGLAEVPLESLAFGAKRAIEDKDGFIDAVVKEIPDTIIGNLAYSIIPITGGGYKVYAQKPIKDFVKSFSKSVKTVLKDQRGGIAFGAEVGIEPEVAGVPVKDLRAYEKATNVSDTKTMDALSAKHPDDARFQIHKRLPSLFKLKGERGAIQPSAEVGGPDMARAIKDIAVPSVKKKVNLLDYARTPDRVLRKIGLGDVGDKLRVAWRTYSVDRDAEVNWIAQLRAQVPNSDDPGVKARIFNYLDTGNRGGLSRQELAAGDKIKAWFANWADKLELPADKRIAHYITHIFERDFIEKEFDPEVAKLITGRVPGSVYDPFLEKRLGKMGYIQDPWRAMEAYAKRATRKFNMDPVLKEMSKRAKDLDLESYNYVQKLGARINMRPTEIDNLTDNFIKSVVGYRYGQRPVTYLTRKWRRAVYRGALGLNVSSSLRNLTQGANTYAKLGEKYTTIGYLKLLREGTDEVVAQGVLRDSFIQDRTVHSKKRFIDSLDKVLFGMFQKAEAINRGAAYHGAKSKALAEGKTEPEAIEFARDLVRDTQFTFGKVDTPLALSSDTAKTLAQFQSYNVKQLEFLGEMVKNKELGGLIRYITATMLIYGSLGKAIGWTFKQALPSIEMGGGGPFGQAVKAGAGLIAPSEETREQAIRGVGKTLPLLVPGGVQLKKTISGLRAFERGRSVTPGGTIRFRIDPTIANLIKTGVFGQYAVPGAREYFRKFR